MAEASANLSKKRRRAPAFRSFDWVGPQLRQEQNPTKTFYSKLDINGSHFCVGGFAAVYVTRSGKRVRARCTPDAITHVLT